MPIAVQRNTIQMFLLLFVVVGNQTDTQSDRVVDEEPTFPTQLKAAFRLVKSKEDPPVHDIQAFWPNLISIRLAASAVSEVAVLQEPSAAIKARLTGLKIFEYSIVPALSTLFNNTSELPLLQPIQPSRLKEEALLINQQSYCKFKQLLVAATSLSPTTTQLSVAKLQELPDLMMKSFIIFITFEQAVPEQDVVTADELLVVLEDEAELRVNTFRFVMELSEMNWLTERRGFVARLPEFVWTRQFCLRLFMSLMAVVAWHTPAPSLKGSLGHVVICDKALMKGLTELTLLSCTFCAKSVSSQVMVTQSAGLTKLILLIQKSLLIIYHKTQITVQIILTPLYRSCL